MAAEIIEARLKRLAEQYKDRISDLPSNIITNIISRLPIRDAGKTSVLSKTWRHSWLSVPSLVFDDHFAKVPLEIPNEADKKRKLLFDIFKILWRHRGPLHTFSLSISKLSPCPEIDQIMLYLSGSDIENLEILILSGVNLDDLSIFSYSPQKIPSCLFLMLQLRTLSLRCCRLKPPPSFKGFSRLTHLELDEVDTDSELNEFISNCPLLSHLKLHHREYCKGVILDAPKLESFSYEGPSCDLTFKNTPILEEARIHSTQYAELVSEEVNTSNFVKVLGSLPQLKSLSVSHRYLRNLAVGGLPEKFPTLLNALQLCEMRFNDPNVVSSALCLLRSSPDLEELHIEADHEMVPMSSARRNLVPNLIKGQAISDYALNQLQCIEMCHITSLMSQMEFVKFLLSVSLNLENMIISTRASYDTEEMEILKEHTKILELVTQFRRASPKAEVLVSSEAELDVSGADNA